MCSYRKLLPHSFPCCSHIEFHIYSFSDLLLIHLLPLWPRQKVHWCLHMCGVLLFRCDRRRTWVICFGEGPTSLTYHCVSNQYWVHPKKRLLRVLNTIWSLSSDATFWRRVTWKKMFRQQQQSLHLPHQRQKEDKSSKHKLQGKEAKLWHSVFVQVHNQYWTNQNKVLFSPRDQSILSFTINGISRITIPPYCLAWRYANMYFSDVVTQNWQGAPSIS